MTGNKIMSLSTLRLHQYSRMGAYLNILLMLL